MICFVAAHVKDGAFDGDVGGVIGVGALVLLSDMIVFSRSVSGCKDPRPTVTFRQVVYADDVVFWGIKGDRVLRFERHICDLTCLEWSWVEGAIMVVVLGN